MTIEQAEKNKKSVNRRLAQLRTRSEKELAHGKVKESTLNEMRSCFAQIDYLNEKISVLSNKGR